MEHYGIVNDTQAQRSFIQQVYLWMALALFTTGLVAFSVASSTTFVEMMAQSATLPFILLFAELGLVMVISGMINKISSMTAIALFFIYSVLNGLTFSSLFIYYTYSSIASVFFISAITFGAMCAYGYFTKRDLTSIGSLCFMGLIGVIVASIVNIFITNNVFTLIVSVIGILVFIGLTAFDTQKIKKMSWSITQGENAEIMTKGSIIGALTLYLDFVNLFLYTLRLFGKRR